jgi:tripartite-type tricarboxylate transporter receptor subunit TctC
MFNMRAGTDVQHIPQRHRPGLNDLLGGQVASVVHRRAHGLASSRPASCACWGHFGQPLAYSRTPTAEQGLKDFDASVFFGIVVPSGTPQEVVTKLNAAFTQVLQQPDIKQRLAEKGLEPPPQYTPAQLAAYMRAEAAKWQEVIKVSGAKAD